MFEPLRFSVVLAALACSASAQDPGEFFESRVRPVLSKNCFACHTSSKLGGLQLDSREHLLHGGNSGPAIVPGQPDSSLLALFDFPNPNNMSEQGTITVGPLQRLYFLNNDFGLERAKALAERLEGDSDERKIVQAYRLLFGRQPAKSEVNLGMDFLRQSGRAWPQYAQALHSSSEFSSVN